MPKMFSYTEFTVNEISEMCEFYDEDTPPIFKDLKCQKCGSDCEACYTPFPKHLRQDNHDPMNKTLGQACKLCLDKYVILDSNGKPKGVMVNNVLELSIL